jgi:hypothetical protein
MVALFYMYTYTLTYQARSMTVNLATFITNRDSLHLDIFDCLTELTSLC